MADAEEMPEPPEIPEDLKPLLVGVAALEKAAHLASSYFDELVARGFAQQAALHLVCGWQETFFRVLYEQNLQTYERRDNDEHQSETRPGGGDPEEPASPQT